MFQKCLPYSFFILTRGYIHCFYFIFLESRREKRGREKVASCTHPDHGSNLRSRYVCWAGIGPTTFCYTGWHSNRRSHLAMADGYHILKPPALLSGNWSGPVTARVSVPSATWCFTVNFSPSPTGLVSEFCSPWYTCADSKPIAAWISRKPAGGVKAHVTVHPFPSVIKCRAMVDFWRVAREGVGNPRKASSLYSIYGGKHCFSPFPSLRLFGEVRSRRVCVMKVGVLALHSPHKSSSSMCTLKVFVLQLLCPGCFLSHPPLLRLQALPLREVSQQTVSSPPVGLTSASYKIRQTRVSCLLLYSQPLWMTRFTRHSLFQTRNLSGIFYFLFSLLFSPHPAHSPPLSS